MGTRIADYAATTDWSGIQNKPDFTASVTDIVGLKGNAFTKNDIVTWSGSKFVPVKRNALISTSEFYSTSNLPYDVFGYSWNPGTLTPFLRTTNSFVLTGVTEGEPVGVGVPYSLDGVLVSVDSTEGLVTVTLFNSTPYDIELVSGVWNILVMK